MKGKNYILRSSVIPSTSMKKSIIKSESSRCPNLNPNGYFWEANILYHDGSTLKKKRERNTSIRLGNEIVRYIHGLADSIHDSDLDFPFLTTSPEDEVWKPLILSTKRHTEIDEEDKVIFSERFLVSQYGNINSVKGFENQVGHIYWHKNDHDFHITIKTTVDDCIVSRNQSIASLVDNAFGTEFGDKIREIINEIRNKIGVTFEKTSK